MKYKICSKCNVSKEINNFSNNKLKHDGLSSYCRLCVKEMSHKHYIENKSKINMKNRSNYQKNKTKYRESCDKWCKENPERRKSYVRKYNRKLKYETIYHYSNKLSKCECCDENNIEFLTIDHIEGGGTQHRIKLGRSGTAFYLWLKRNNYPSGYRVLCMNCNHAMGIYGKCPHKDNFKY